MENRWNTNDLRLINKLMVRNEKETLHYMGNLLTQYYTREKLLITDSYILGFGSLPVVLVCHCDRVEDFKNGSTQFIYDPVKNLGTTIGGLGLDDRLGLFTMIKLLEKGYLPNIILTTGEERGGIGANHLITIHKQCPFPDAKYLLELDRAGYLNFVMYSNGDPLLEEYIQKTTDYRLEFGSYSDVETIGPAWGIGFANLSIAYYNEHTYSEYVDVLQWHETLYQIELLLKDSINAPTFKYIEHKYYNYLWGNNFYDLPHCAECGIADPEMEYAEVINEAGLNEMLCVRCMKAITNHCMKCNELYIPDINNTDTGLCPYCEINDFKKIKYGVK